MNPNNPNPKNSPSNEDEINVYIPTEEEKEKMCIASDKIIDILNEFDDKFKQHILKSIAYTMSLTEEEMREMLK